MRPIVNGVVNIKRPSSVGVATEPPTAERHLSVHVIATTPPGTRAALKQAAACVADLDAYIVLLVPQVVPYVQPLDQPAHSPSLVGQRFLDMAGTIGVDVTIRVCLCRSASSVASVLPDDALVLVGGRRRWWRTREQRLAAELTDCGFRALFVDTLMAASETSEPAA